MLNVILNLINISLLIFIPQFKPIDPSVELTICIDGIRNNKGVIRLAFYHNDEEFQSDQPFRSETIDKDSIKNRMYCVYFTDFEPGTYGIALLDDENNNNRMDYELFIPKEGFGFSDYYPESLKRPKFDDFKFLLNRQKRTVKIRIKYF
jgi:uncharacterized protein (DUF2141 family)